MAYYINAKTRMATEIAKAITKHFGKVVVTVDNDKNILVEIAEDAGFDRIYDCLSTEEIESGQTQIGGGVKESLNGRNFRIVIDSDYWSSS